MSSVNLNLARKWRSKSFDQLIGQELVVRMLKNSLYLGHYFPVYLFSGQRGCGKTSTARIFASALNCEQLEQFQKDPRSCMVPCQACTSCVAMQANKHPDFIEIDAASHTGVDNVRNIIDSSSLLPLMGRKKIYLIDEAHMLSKAAFNAFLKIMEEPPASVIFILATTDTQKIIETVRSRCFQLLFKPVESTSLVQHLQQICVAEKVKADVVGLELIVKETEGSVRDALNLLEQVRFSSAGVTKDSVLSVLGYLDDERLIKLYTILVMQGPKELLSYLHAIAFEQFDAEFIWHRLIELSRSLIWVKHGLPAQEFIEHVNEQKKLARVVSWKQLSTIIDQLCSQELIFARTTAKHSYLEMVLLQLCYKGTDHNDNNSSSLPPQQAQEVEEPAHEGVLNDIEDQGVDVDEQEDEETDEDGDDQEDVALWQLFVVQVVGLNDPLLASIFKQGVLQQFDKTTATLHITFSKELVFFNDWLSNTKPLWLPLLQRIFENVQHVIPAFTGESKAQAVINLAPVEPVHKVVAVNKPAAAPQQKPVNAYQNSHNNFYKRVERKPVVNKLPAFDVSDTAQWKKAHMVLQYFPGTIVQLNEGAHEPVS